MLLASERRGLVVMASASIALALIAIFAFSARAQAKENLYWNNYSATPANLAFAGIGGSSGGGILGPTGDLESPEGMAYDSVTNRLFVADDSSGTGRIVAVNLDGSGANVFSAPGAPVNGPEGLTLDPATRTVYWINTGDDNIAWARLDGGAGGLLSLTGVSAVKGFRLAIDAVGGRVYWGEEVTGEPDRIAFANTNNTGGGILDISGATPPEFITGVAIDEVGRRIYWVDGTLKKIQSASLNGGGGADIPVPASPNQAYGLNFDPSQGRVLWGNYEPSKETNSNQFGYGLLAGGGGAFSVGIQTYGVQDPVIIRSPTGTGAPTLTQSPQHPAELACSTGSWAADAPGGFVYQAPRAFAYQWSVDGAVLGAGPDRISATKAGSYACTVTATNQTGSAVQASGAVAIKATKVKLSTKKKGIGKPGKPVRFKVRAVNQGDIDTRSSTKICVKLPKASKADLKTPKCKQLGPLKGRTKKTVTIKVKVKGGADLGTDKLTFKVKGAAGKAAKAKIVVK